MILKYTLIFVLLSCSLIYSMNFDALPPEEQAFLNAIKNNDNSSAEQLLQEHTTIDINRCMRMYPPDKNLQRIQHSLMACYESDNGHMLEVLVHKGLDTTTFHKLFDWAVLDNNAPVKQHITKILLEHGVLKGSIKQHLKSFVALIIAIKHLSKVEKNKFIQCTLDNGLTLYLSKRYMVLLFKFLADALHQYDLHTYSMHATHACELTFLSDPSTSIKYKRISIPEEFIKLIINSKHITKEHLENIRTQYLTGYTDLIEVFKKRNFSLTVDTESCKELLTYFANNGCTELIKYLVFENNLLPSDAIETIIANAKAYQEDPENFSFNYIEEIVKNEMSILTDQQETETIKYLHQQWLAHKNKNVVKLLRRLVIIARLFNALVPKEIAYKIAQYDSADFQDQRLTLLPSYDQVREFIAQRA